MKQFNVLLRTEANMKSIGQWINEIFEKYAIIDPDEGFLSDEELKVILADTNPQASPRFVDKLARLLHPNG
jgi:hypothetical protein